MFHNLILVGAVFIIVLHNGTHLLKTWATQNKRHSCRWSISKFYNNMSWSRWRLHVWLTITQSHPLFIHISYRNCGIDFYQGKIWTHLKHYEMETPQNVTWIFNRCLCPLLYSFTLWSEDFPWLKMDLQLSL